MIADIGSLARAAVHPTMVKPNGSTLNVTMNYLDKLDAAPSTAPSARI